MTQLSNDGLSHDRLSDDGRSHGPSRFEADELREYIVDQWFALGGLDAPTFLWNHEVEDESRERETRLLAGGIMPANVGFAIAVEPMKWYYQTVTGIDMAQADDDMTIDLGAMPTFRMDSEALAGVRAVAGNAMMSSDYVSALANLAMLVEQTAVFLDHVPDREGEGEEFLDALIWQMRVYADIVARNADASTSEQAIAAVTHLADVPALRRMPASLIEALSSCLPFAQWDDTRVLAYGALNQALQSIQSQDCGDDFTLMHTLMDFLRHDLLRMAGDNEAADGFLGERLASAPFAEAYAARLYEARRYDELLDVIRTVCMNDAHPDDHATEMLPADVVPDGWGTILEATYESMGDEDALDELYRRRESVGRA